MVNTLIYFICSKKCVTRTRKIKMISSSPKISSTYSWEIMSIEDVKAVKLFVFFLLLKLDIHLKLLFLEEIMKVKESQEYMVSSMKLREGIKLVFGKPFIQYSIICRLLLSLMKRLCVCMEAFPKKCSALTK